MIVELLIQLLAEILLSLFVCLFVRLIDTEVAKRGLHMKNFAVGRVGEDINLFNVDRRNRRCRGFRFQYGVGETYSARIRGSAVASSRTAGHDEAFIDYPERL